MGGGLDAVLGPESPVPPVITVLQGIGTRTAAARGLPVPNKPWAEGRHGLRQPLQSRMESPLCPLVPRARAGRQEEPPRPHCLLGAGTRRPRLSGAFSGRLLESSLQTLELDWPPLPRDPERESLSGREPRTRQVLSRTDLLSGGSSIRRL